MVTPSNIIGLVCFMTLLPAYTMETKRINIDGKEQIIRIVRDTGYLKAILNATNQRSLVVFDVDGTLIVDKDPYDRGHTQARLQARTVEALAHGPVKWYTNHYGRVILASRARELKESRLVHEDLPTIIQDLNKRGVPTIALTHCNTGQCGCIPSVEDWRLGVLKDLGIEFNGAFAKQPEKMFATLCQRGKAPVFKQGVLFTGHVCDKGALLAAFLKEPFEKVICIDDDPANLVAEYKALAWMNIPNIVLVCYKAACSLPSVFDKRVAEFQLQYLREHDKWLTGEQASAKLKEECLSDFCRLLMDICS